MTLARSRRWCALVMRRHAKSFFWSTRFLPKGKREAIEALYGFFRYTDDIVDEGDAPPATRRAGVAAVRAQLARIDEPLSNGLPWGPALRATLGAYELDRAQLDRLVDGCASDLEPVRITTTAELERYAGAVAGSVGRCVIPVLGAPDADSSERAERLGIAMQLTNVLRDVETDALLGRNYLPLAERAGVPLPDVMRDIARQARAYYREAPILAARLPNDGSRVALLTAASLYERILDGLERRNYDPAGGRVFVGLGAKVRVAAQCALAAHTGFATIR
jgi:phytoene synthase